MKLHIKQGRTKMGYDELQAHLNIKKQGHVHKNKKKIINRHKKYK